MDDAVGVGGVRRRVSGLVVRWLFTMCGAYVAYRVPGGLVCRQARAGTGVKPRLATPMRSSRASQRRPYVVRRAEVAVAVEYGGGSKKSLRAGVQGVLGSEPRAQGRACQWSARVQRRMTREGDARR